MSQIQIQTTQNVVLSFTPASVGDRILAHLIDWVIFMAWFLVFVLVASGMGSVPFANKTATIVLVVGIMLPIMFYDLLFEVFMNGQSLGKRAMNIRVLALDGTPPTLGAYLMRWIFRLVDTSIFGSTVALIVAVVNGKGQRLGDIAAGTAVVKLKQTVSLEQLKQEKIQENYVPLFPEAALLSDRDVTTVRAVLRKSQNESNNSLIRQTAQKVKEVTDIQADMDDTAFLEQLLQDYTHLTTIA